MNTQIASDPFCEEWSVKLDRSKLDKAAGKLVEEAYNREGGYVAIQGQKRLLVIDLEVGTGELQ